MANIGVLGAGTWGVALARTLAVSGHGVTVWSALPAEIDALSTTRTHINLPGMMIPDEILFTKKIAEACLGMDIVLFAVPSVYLRGTTKAAAPFVKAGQVLVTVAKGIEPGTLFTMTRVMEDELRSAGKEPMPLVALSGPTHAEEVALELPTAIVSASEDTEAAAFVQSVFMNSWFRVYTNEDVEGVELCGAVKNVIALASGISSGLGFGDNAKAGLITRGIAELSRLGVAMGCQKETFAGLAGIGDLIVTATSQHSRNNRCGYLIGQGVSPEDAVKQVGMVVEGINALPATVELSKKYEVEMPIVAAVNEIIADGADPREVVSQLMIREKKAEN